jgi:hypothetical protein
MFDVDNNIVGRFSARLATANAAAMGMALLSTVVLGVLPPSSLLMPAVANGRGIVVPNVGGGGVGGRGKEAAGEEEGLLIYLSIASSSKSKILSQYAALFVIALPDVGCHFDHSQQRKIMAIKYVC